MSLHSKARALAALGSSNAEIFGELEISSGALQKLLVSDPKLLFSIVQGRSELISSLIEKIREMANGVEVTKAQYEAIRLLLDRLDTNNRQLLSAYDLVLLQSSISGLDDGIRRDPAKVTELLRSVK